MRVKALFALPLMAVAACSPSHADSPQSQIQQSRIQAQTVAPAAGQQRHPVSNLAVIPLSVGPHKFAVEVAASRAEQARGLMFRTQIGPDEGMIFPFDPPRPASFWMRNTVIPLDIIFIGPDRRVLNIAADAIPYDETPLSSLGQAAAVLELNGGRAAQLGIKPGDLVQWSVPGPAQ
ncbi:MAG: DUF192 domain-containing protein [Sphingomonadales bacterium]|nr:DUF192 domain-containing protein [Sphingomonadales bacterium]MBU3993704.1 DUF192 domain-containing protein [Alphaproteobacteria bacterium]